MSNGGTMSGMQESGGVRLHPHIVNEKLNITSEELMAMGFTKYEDGTGSPFGMGWEMNNRQFAIDIDCTQVVKLARKNPDSDHITLYVDDKFALECLVDWIAPDERETLGQIEWFQDLLEALEEGKVEDAKAAIRAAVGMLEKNFTK
jgi:hypothetical protein